MKKMRKGLPILIALSLALGFGAAGGPEVFAAKKKAVKVKSLSLNYAKKTLTVGKTLTLKAKIKPKKAKGKIRWSSSNKKVATVSAKGKVKAVKKGTAKITAAVKGTKVKKVCKITVKAKPSVNTNGPNVAPAPVITQPPVVPASSVPAATPTPTAVPAQDTVTISKQGDVDAALDCAVSDPKIKVVKIATDQAESIELPEGDFSKCELIIEAPKADISNHAVFKKITINEIASDTYKEYAEGNEINANCPIGRIIITDRAKAVLNVLKDASEISVVVNGEVSGIHVSAKDSVVDISGSAEAPIKVKVDEESEIKSSHLLEVQASAKVTFVVYPGAEDSEFYVDNSGLLPKVYGVGSIKVNIEDSGDVQTIYAEYRDEVSGEQQIVSLEGSIVDYDTDAKVKGATVYIVPYTNAFDEANIEQNSYLKTSVTDENGDYKFDSIYTGNYIMAVKEDGMVTAVQYLVITSRYGNTFRNETLKLFPQTDANEPGTITGILSNSVDGKPIEGLTARLRKGKGNTVGTVLTKTTSDAQGSYTFGDVEPGYYTVEFVDLRNGQNSGKYITTSMNAVVRSGKTDTVSTALTESVSFSQVRFILTWGDETSGAPSDLDSHLLGPKKKGVGRFHTYFSAKEYVEGGIHYADLDHDDIDYEGPETSTIYEPVPGKYEFYIHDYTNRGSYNSTALATSGAKVEVYQGTTLLVTYYVPNNAGTVWHVCSYDSNTGTLTQHDEMYYESDPEEVGTDPKDRAMIALKDYVDSLKTWIDRLKDNAAKAALKQKYDAYTAFLSADASGYTLQEIQGKVSEASELIDGLKEGLYIKHIRFAEGVDSSCDIDNLDSHVTISTLEPAQAVIEEVELPEGASYKLIKDNSGIVSAIEVTSGDGYVISYGVSYQIPSWYYNIDEINGENVSRWETDYDYDEDDNRVDFLYIYTYDGKAGDFTLVPEYSDKAQVSYEKDTAGTITGVVMSVGTQTRKYQVKYVFDSNMLQPAAIETEAVDDWDTDWEYADEGIVYYLDIWTEFSEGCNFVVTPKNENVRVEYEKEGDVIRFVTFSVGDQIRTYEVRYKVPTRFFGIGDVTGDGIGGWDTDYDYDYDGNRVDILSVFTKDGNSSAFTLVPSYSDKAQVSYEKDASGVINGVTISVGSSVKTYRVEYAFDTSLLLPEDIISDHVLYWDYDWDYDENYEKFYYLELKTETGESCDFTVKPKLEDAQVDYMEEGDTITNVKITIGNHSRGYQVRYQ